MRRARRVNVSERGGLPASPSPVPGLPTNISPHQLSRFTTLNTQVGRASIADEEMAWCDNLVPIGDNFLRCLPDLGPSIYNAGALGRRIVEFDFFTTPSNSYAILFLDDGSAVAVDVVSSAVTAVAPPGTFQPEAFQVALCQAGLAGENVLLIVTTSDSGNGYFIWDGTNLFQAGTLSPVAVIDDPGSGYTSNPSVAVIFGGTGSGGAAVATEQFGLVDQVNVTAPGSGYSLGDQAAMIFSGGGRGTTAYGTAIVTDNVLTSITVISGGSGFTSIPLLTITPVSGGSGAVAVVTSLSGGVITGVQVLSGGSGYTGGVTIATSGGGGGSAVFAGVIESGVITGVTMINGGSDYTSTPTVNYLASTGSGAGGRVVFQNAQVIGVVFDYPSQGGFGYPHSPAPVVQFVGGGGPAAGHIEMMPFGVQGTDIETYVGRVWIADGNRILFTAPTSLVEFGINGGGAFQSTDSFLRNSYVHLRQSNGFLYLIGDSSVNYISGVTTSGTPSITTFSNLNIDPQIGARWHDSVTTYSRSIAFVNAKGVYVITGGAVQKASPQLDGIFNTAPLVGFNQVSSAVAQIFSVDTLCVLYPIVDPFEGLRTGFLLWNGKRWWTGSQSANIFLINSLEVNSTLTAYGTDGANFYPLFQAPSVDLTKRLQSKLWIQPGIEIQKQAWAIQALFECYSNTTLTWTIDSESGSVAVTQGAFTGASGIAWGRSSASAPSGQAMGFTMTSNSADFALITALLMLRDLSLRV
jgi:hypothetical protein